MPISSGGSGSVPTLAAASASVTSGDLTTTSTSFVDAAGVTVTMTTGARRVLLTFNGSVQQSLAANGISLDFAVDGTRQGQTNGLILITQQAAAALQDASFTFVTAVLTAASHTFKVQWKTSATGTATMSASAAVNPAIISAVELLQAT